MYNIKANPLLHKGPGDQQLVHIIHHSLPRTNGDQQVVNYKLIPCYTQSTLRLDYGSEMNEGIVELGYTW